MSLLRLSNYQGKPYSAGFSNSKATEFSALNLLEMPSESHGLMGKANQLLVPVKLELEKGPECRVVQTIGEDDLPSVSILDPEVYDGHPDIDQINYRAINYRYLGTADLEMESGEMAPLSEMGYALDFASGDIVGRQEFEVLTGDVAYEEGDDIDLYPLGAIIDSGKSIDHIQPAYFRISEHGGETQLKVITTDKVKSVGGLYSPDGFDYGDNHYRFITAVDESQHLTLHDFVKSGGISIRLSLSIESGGAAAASSSSASSNVIEIKSCNLYGSKPDEIMIGFDLSSVRL